MASNVDPDKGLTTSKDFVNAKADPFDTPQEKDVPGDAAGAKDANHKDHNHPETAFCVQSCPHFILAQKAKEKATEKAEGR